jgi:hypothetical protein
LSYKTTPKYGFKAPESNQLDDVPTDLYGVVLQIEELLDDFPIAELADGTAGQLIVAQGTGAALYKTLSGDATLSSAGALTIGENKITAGKIAALAIETAKLANLAVTAAKIGEEAVESAKIKTAAITAAKIAAEAVTAAKLAEGAVTPTKLAALAVETAKLAEEAITTAKIANLAVTTAKLADGAVTSPKFKPTTGIVAATGTLTLGALADIPGATLTLTPSVPSKLRVTGVFDFQLGGSSAGSTQARGYLDVDGAKQTRYAEADGFAKAEQWNWQGTVVQVWEVALTAAEHTAKLRAEKLNVGNGTVNEKQTCFMYELVAS